MDDVTPFTIIFETRSSEFGSKRWVREADAVPAPSTATARYNGRGVWAVYLALSVDNFAAADAWIC
jgi:hypothetical protein